MKHSSQQRFRGHSGKPGKFGSSPFKGKRPFKGSFKGKEGSSEGFSGNEGSQQTGDRFKGKDRFKDRVTPMGSSRFKSKGRFQDKENTHGEDRFKAKERFQEKSRFKGKDRFKDKERFPSKERFAGKDRFKDKTFAKPRPDRSSHARPERAAAPRRDFEKPASDMPLIWGLHAARAAWLNPKRRCIRLWLTEAGKASFEASIAEAKDALLKRPDFKLVVREELERLTPPSSVHQGILLEAAPLHEPALHEIINVDNPPDLLLMLDQVTDPHNVGAILRSAAAFGAGAVIMTERNAPIVTGVQAKAASGAMEHLPQIHVVNLARALDELQEAGYWRIGLAEEGEKNLGELDLSGRTVLVVGNEGEGLRQLTRKKCDELARLPTGGAIGSLNVSNAAAVALYEVRRQKNNF